MALLLLKILLVPLLIAGVTLGARRWGPRIGGWLNGLPVVAGPVLYFLGIEQGAPFMARAAEATLAGLVAVAAFALVYAWTALRRPWWACLGAGWASFGAATVVLHAVTWRPVPALTAALGGFALSRALLPEPRGARGALRWPAWDLPLRMAAAVALVLAVTGLARWLGPRLSGALTPFPIATAILLAFTHAQQGTAAALWFLRGFLPAMWSFAAFCFVVAVGAPALGRDLAFATAIAVQVAVQGLLLLGLGRHRTPVAQRALPFWR